MAISKTSSRFCALLSTMAAISPGSCLAEEASPLPQPEAYQQRLVDWIRSGENGFFHPSVVWKRLGPDGKSGSYAMHTTVDIPKGEKLLVVPRSHTIDSLKTHENCFTIARMLDEYEKGDDSFYAPYLSYLFDDTEGGTTSGLLPTSWSEDGQNLLNQVLYGREGKSAVASGLEPKIYAHATVFEDCGTNFRSQHPDGKIEDETLRRRAEDAYYFMLSRSWADKLIPVLDMYNHRNGASKNVESTTVHYSDNDITAFALRDIKAGEQLQNTYSECMDDDCNWGKMQYEYLTPHIFMDYGFLELYPRRWELGPTNHEIVAEVDEDLETGEKEFKWIFQKPTSTALRWISNHLERLQSMEEEIREGVERHRRRGSEHYARYHNIEHEADSILEMYEGYVEVLSMAHEHRNDGIGVTREQFEELLEDARNTNDEQYDEL